MGKTDIYKGQMSPRVCKHSVTVSICLCGRGTVGPACAHANAHVLVNNNDAVKSPTCRRLDSLFITVYMSVLLIVYVRERTRERAKSQRERKSEREREREREMNHTLRDACGERCSFLHCG